MWGIKYICCWIPCQSFSKILPKKSSKRHWNCYLWCAKTTRLLQLWPGPFAVSRKTPCPWTFAARQSLCFITLVLGSRRCSRFVRRLSMILVCRYSCKLWMEKELRRDGIEIYRNERSDVFSVYLMSGLGSFQQVFDSSHWGGDCPCFPCSGIFWAFCGMLVELRAPPRTWLKLLCGSRYCMNMRQRPVDLKI